MRPTGKGISGATVDLTGTSHSASTTTGSGGRYSVNLPNGTYSLRASASGYVEGEKNLTVVGHTLSGIDVVLSSVGADIYRVSGSVLANGVGLAGALVEVSGSDGSAHATTSAAGVYTVELPNGTYALHATALRLLGEGEGGHH